MIRAVLFDLDETLIPEDEPLGFALRRRPPTRMPPRSWRGCGRTSGSGS